MVALERDEKKLLAILSVALIGIAAVIYFDIQRQDACEASGKHWVATTTRMIFVTIANGMGSFTLIPVWIADYTCTTATR